MQRNNQALNEQLLRDEDIKRWIKELKDAYAEHQTVTEEMIEKMKKLRERFIDYNQPTIVKSIRLTYEYVERFEKFEVTFVDEEEEEEIVADYPYFLGLITN